MNGAMDKTDFFTFIYESTLKNQYACSFLKEYNSIIFRQNSQICALLHVCQRIDDKRIIPILFCNTIRVVYDGQLRLSNSIEHVIKSYEDVNIDTFFTFYTPYSMKRHIIERGSVVENENDNKAEDKIHRVRKKMYCSDYTSVTTLYETLPEGTDEYDEVFKSSIDKTNELSDILYYCFKKNYDLIIPFLQTWRYSRQPFELAPIFTDSPNIIFSKIIAALIFNIPMFTQLKFHEKIIRLIDALQYDNLLDFFVQIEHDVDILAKWDNFIVYCFKYNNNGFPIYITPARSSMDDVSIWIFAIFLRLLQHPNELYSMQQLILNSFRKQNVSFLDEVNNKMFLNILLNRNFVEIYIKIQKYNNTINELYTWEKIIDTLYAMYNIECEHKFEYQLVNCIVNGQNSLSNVISKSTNHQILPFFQPLIFWKNDEQGKGIGITVTDNDEVVCRWTNIDADVGRVHNPADHFLINEHILYKLIDTCSRNFGLRSFIAVKIIVILLNDRTDNSTTMKVHTIKLLYQYFLNKIVNTAVMKRKQMYIDILEFIFPSLPLYFLDNFFMDIQNAVYSQNINVLKDEEYISVHQCIDIIQKCTVRSLFKLQEDDNSNLPYIIWVDTCQQHIFLNKLDLIISLLTLDDIKSDGSYVNERLLTSNSDLENIFNQDDMKNYWLSISTTFIQQLKWAITILKYIADNKLFHSKDSVISILASFPLRRKLHVFEAGLDFYFQDTLLTRTTDLCFIEKLIELIEKRKLACCKNEVLIEIEKDFPTTINHFIQTYVGENLSSFDQIARCVSLPKLFLVNDDKNQICGYVIADDGFEIFFTTIICPYEHYTQENITSISGFKFASDLINHIYSINEYDDDVRTYVDEINNIFLKNIAIIIETILNNDRLKILFKIFFLWKGDNFIQGEMIENLWSVKEGKQFLIMLCCSNCSFNIFTFNNADDAKIQDELSLCMKRMVIYVLDSGDSIDDIGQCIMDKFISGKANYKKLKFCYKNIDVLTVKLITDSVDTPLRPILISVHEPSVINSVDVADLLFLIQRYHLFSKLFFCFIPISDTELKAALVFENYETSQEFIDDCDESNSLKNFILNIMHKKVIQLTVNKKSNIFENIDVCDQNNIYLAHIIQKWRVYGIRYDEYLHLNNIMKYFSNILRSSKNDATLHKIFLSINNSSPLNNLLCLSDSEFQYSEFPLSLNKTFLGTYQHLFLHAKNYDHFNDLKMKRKFQY